MVTDLKVGGEQEERNIGHSEKVKRVQGQSSRSNSSKIMNCKNTKLIFFNLNFPDHNEVTREELELDSLRNIHTKPNSQLRNGGFVFFCTCRFICLKRQKSYSISVDFLCEAWQWQLLLKNRHEIKLKK